MRLISFIANNRTSVGLLSTSGESVFPSEGYVDALTFLSAGEASWAETAKLGKTASKEELISLSEVTLRSLVPRPEKILCIGVNYRDYAAETGLRLPKVPEVFAKFTSSVVGDGTTVVIPAATKEPDNEAERIRSRFDCKQRGDACLSMVWAPPARPLRLGTKAQANLIANTVASSPCNRCEMSGLSARQELFR
jgi:Fumarylacetoacetate (FAA) hydrolase family